MIKDWKTDTSVLFRFYDVQMYMFIQIEVDNLIFTALFMVDYFINLPVF